MKLFDRSKLCCLFLVLLCAACAAVPSVKPVPYPEEKIMPGVPSDEDLYLLGTSYLGNAELTPDYFNARAAFDKLVKTYPDSKWRNSAQLYIRLIDEIRYLKSKKSAELPRQDNEKLKKRP